MRKAAITIHIGANDSERSGTTAVVNDLDHPISVTFTTGDGPIAWEIRVAAIDESDEGR